jgi:hypothetical protein
LASSLPIDALLMVLAQLAITATSSSSVLLVPQMLRPLLRPQLEPDAALTEHALPANIAMNSSSALMVLQLRPLLAQDAELMVHALLDSIAMNSSSALMANPLSRMRSLLNALLTPIAPLITTATSSTGAFQVPLESRLVPDAALMAPVPMASIAMSSNSALMEQFSM